MESQVQYRPADPETAAATADSLSEEGRSQLDDLIQELEDNPECVGVWCSIG